MSSLVVKVYMIQVKPKTLLLLQNILSDSVQDSDNLIVHSEELNSKFSNLEQNRETRDIIKKVVESKGNEVEYVWFYV